MTLPFHLLLLLFFLMIPRAANSVTAEPWLSTGRQADPVSITLSEIRAAERRRIPLEVALKTSNHYTAGEPVDVSIMVTNLFDPPLVMNSRMLVNHPLLPGELSFRITGPDGQKIEIQRLITPLSIRDEDFVALTRGQSIQRNVDLADLFGFWQRGVYKLQVSYHNEIDHSLEGQGAWKGLVWSEPVEIQLD